MKPHPAGPDRPRSVSRRTFVEHTLLRGSGVAVAVPALQSLSPRGAWAHDTVVPTRMAFLYVPNGVNVAQWRPSGDGIGYRLGPSLAPVQPYRDELQFISGLSHRGASTDREGGGAHARAMATILTGVSPRKTGGADIRAGVSVDQVAAAHIGDATRFSSLELSCDAVRTSGTCDLGYSCVYSFNMSWRSPTQPAVPETNPRLVFERLFGAGRGPERAASLRARIEGRRSVLDFVRAEARALDRRLGAADRRVFDEYLASVREVEHQIERFERMPLPDVADGDRPAADPASYPEHIRLLCDMLVLAFRTDSTRIATFILAHDGGDRTFPELGIQEGHHTLSHHRQSTDALDKIARIDRFYAWHLAYLLWRLRSIEETDGQSLLHHSMIVYASGLSDGNRHLNADLPVIVAGRAGGRLAAGRHLDLGRETPMANLFLTMLDIMGAGQDRFGDSTGRLDGILA